MAHILTDDVEAHLHIRLALDSNDEIEVLAAVKAAKKFIPCSKYIHYRILKVNKILFF
jgi:hypothetical protein